MAEEKRRQDEMDAKFAALDRAWKEIGVPREATDPAFRGVLQHFVFKNPVAPVSEQLNEAIKYALRVGSSIAVAPEILSKMKLLDASEVQQ